MRRLSLALAKGKKLRLVSFPEFSEATLKTWPDAQPKETAELYEVFHQLVEALNAD